MYSIAFPNIFSSESVNLFKDREATMSNLKLILATELNSLFGDPGYGCALMQTIFSQSDSILKEIVIDEIYSCISFYIPQVTISNKDIKLYVKDKKLYASIKIQNKQDFTTNLYEIELTDTEEII